MTGRYIPTAKNGVARDFFTDFGFSCVSDENGVTTWEVAVNLYKLKATFMTALQPA
jgi:predicted enzyme involved in methoxymalonyl-ACP biosynthesis